MAKRKRTEKTDNFQLTKDNTMAKRKRQKDNTMAKRKRQTIQWPKEKRKKGK